MEIKATGSAGCLIYLSHYNPGTCYGNQITVFLVLREDLSILPQKDTILRMNDIMKRLTVVSTIFIPLTFLVGVWGMNFRNMPELEWEHGYILAWGVMIVIGFVTYLFFRTKKWR